MTTTTTTQTDYSRAAVIARIRTALRRRSGKAWSVTGGSGTAYGWITIDAPPARRTWHDEEGPGHHYLNNPVWVEVDTGKPGGHTGTAERQELARLLGLERVHHQGHNIPASNDYYREAIDRAEGRAPSVIGTPYWD